MSAISSYPLVPLLVTTAALAVAAAALLATRRLRRELTALRGEVAGRLEQDGRTAALLVPGARTAEHDEEIRAAVADALAAERERELAEARAFWAAQEAREAADAPIFDGPGFDGPGFEGPAFDGTGFDPGFEVLPFLPRQVDHLAGGEAEPVPAPPATPAQRRHPSDPEFAPPPVVAGPEQTVARLAELAEARTPLADVRPGPLGTLDLYVFTDGTTLCLTPGDRETAEQLAAALEGGEAPVLLGGSGVSGAYALTFTYGTRSVFVLADRVVASL